MDLTSRILSGHRALPPTPSASAPHDPPDDSILVGGTGRQSLLRRVLRPVPGTERTRCYLLLPPQKPCRAASAPCRDFAALEDPLLVTGLAPGEQPVAGRRPAAAHFGLVGRPRHVMPPASRRASDPYDGHPCRSRPGQWLWLRTADTADRRLGRADERVGGLQSNPAPSYASPALMAPGGSGP
jgi:hypothetical protein